MIHSHYLPTPAFIGLLAWRSLVCSLALYTVATKPLEMAAVALLVLFLMLVLGEGAYRAHLHAAAVAERKEQERLWRERRAEEARLRYEAKLEAQKSADEGYMDLGLDEADRSVRPLTQAPPSQSLDPAAPPTASAMSADEFEAALLDIEVEATVKRLQGG